MDLNKDVLEVDAESIQKFFGHSHVNKSELEDYLGAKVDQQMAKPTVKKKTKTPIPKDAINNTFSLPQEEYILYRLYVQDIVETKRKRENFWNNVKSIFVLLLLCSMFYLLIWLFQSTIPKF